MMKWKYEAILNTCKNILVEAYLNTMHSKNITVIYSVEDKLYYHVLTLAEIAEIARIKPNALGMQAISKKRVKTYAENAIEFASVNEMESLKAEFADFNKGWLAEFLYRIKINGESIEEIKTANNSKGFDIASDTKDGIQIKFIDNGATFTEFEYLEKVCERRNYNKLNEVKEAVKQITEIYQ